MILRLADIQERISVATEFWYITHLYRLAVETEFGPQAVTPVQYLAGSVVICMFPRATLVWKVKCP